MLNSDAILFLLLTSKVIISVLTSYNLLFLYDAYKLQAVLNMYILALSCFLKSEV